LVPGSFEVIGASIHGKNGNQRGTTEDIYAVVVPDKDISKCYLVHLSRYMALTENELTCQRFLFGLGFESKSSTDSRSHFTMMMRPMTAVIKTLFIFQNCLGLVVKNCTYFDQFVLEICQTRRAVPMK